MKLPTGVCQTTRKLTLATALYATLLMPPAWAAQDAAALLRVTQAQQLVDAMDLANTDYEHGPGSVTWSGSVASHTDCSGFIDHLLMHVDGLSKQDFKNWFGIERPTAERYHDAIVAGRGFRQLSSVKQLLPGDVIAIKYYTRHDNTGHIMMVAQAPQKMSPLPPLIDGTSQWSVTIIDSSESGHGPDDTRYKRGADGHDHDGLGRGVFRFYTGEHDEVLGFAWSTQKISKFVAPQDEHVVLGRFIPGLLP